MGTPAQGVTGYYVWEIPGKPLAVHLHLDVIDGLLSALLRGFGTLPKRGAEVGGILLGSVDPGDPAIVRVEDFELVPCEYRRGPSYLLAGDDRAGFESVCERWKPRSARGSYGIGYFRSDTRDALALTQEDIELMDRHFRGVFHIALLIKPFVSKPSVAGFFFREDGVFPAVTPLEFPFRRHELSGAVDSPAAAPADREVKTPKPREALSIVAPPPPSSEIAPAMESPRDAVNEQHLVSEQHLDENSKRLTLRRLGTWAWIPLSFIFLLLGLLLGFQAAHTMDIRAGSQDFSLSLSAAKVGDNLSVRWNGLAPAVRMAPRGVLEIEDGDFKKSVDLDAAQLLNGSVLYRNNSSSVRFRLVVYPNPKTNITETLEWHP